MADELVIAVTANAAYKCLHNSHLSPLLLDIFPCLSDLFIGDLSAKHALHKHADSLCLFAVQLVQVVVQEKVVEEEIGCLRCILVFEQRDSLLNHHLFGKFLRSGSKCTKLFLCVHIG